MVMKLTCFKLVALLFMSTMPLSGFAQSSEVNRQIFFMYSTNWVPEGLTATVPSYIRSLNDAHKLSYGSDVAKYDSFKKNLATVYPTYVGIVESNFPGFVDIFNRNIAAGDALAVANALRSAGLVNFYAGGRFLAGFIKSKSSLITVNNREIMAEVDLLEKNLAVLKSELLALRLGTSVSDSDVSNISARYAPLFTASTQKILKMVSQNPTTTGGSNPSAMSFGVQVVAVFAAGVAVYIAIVYEAAVVIGTVFWASIVSPHGDVSLDKMLKEVPYQVRSIIEARQKI